MGWGGVGWSGVGLGAGTVAPMQRYVVSKEQWLRCRGVEDHIDVVRSRISKASRMSRMPKGAGWKTPMVPRVLMMPVVSRVSVILERMPDVTGTAKDRVFKEELMSRNEGWSRWNGEDMRMTAMKAVLRTEDQKGSRKAEYDGKARRDMASSAISVVLVQNGSDHEVHIFRPPPQWGGIGFKQQ